MTVASTLFLPSCTRGLQQSLLTVVDGGVEVLLLQVVLHGVDGGKSGVAEPLQVQLHGRDPWHVLRWEGWIVWGPVRWYLSRYH